MAIIVNGSSAPGVTNISVTVGATLAAQPTLSTVVMLGSLKVGSGGADELNGTDGNDRLFGGVGDDVLIGGLGNDTLDGGDGDDVIFGDVIAEEDKGKNFAALSDEQLKDVSARSDKATEDAADEFKQKNPSFDLGANSKDRIIGGAGNDIIFAGTGNDTILGGTGNDRIFAGKGDDLVSGGADNDAIYGEGGNDRLSGDAGDDRIDGGEGNDSIWGGAGQDTLSGGIGADMIFGGDGNDVASGGDGNDQIWGEAGDDVLSGDNGNDTLSGGAGDDTLSGGADNDALSGGAGADSLSGDDGNDRLYGDAGADTLSGGTGNDQLWGGADNDELYGGEGNDLLSGDAGKDFLYGEGGNDTLLGGDGDDVLDGADGADVLRGDAGNDVLLGGAGNDNLSGGAGNDILSGGADNDTLDGGEGSDVVDGGDGDDLAIFVATQGANDAGSGTYPSAGGDIYRGGAGTDTLRVYLTSDQIANSLNGDLLGYLASGGNISGKTVKVYDANGNQLLEASEFEKLQVFVDNVGVVGKNGGKTVLFGKDTDFVDFDQVDFGKLPSGTNLLNALGGNDIVLMASSTSSGANAVFNGPDGKDGLDKQFDAGDGDDRVFGRDRNENIAGGKGNDALWGGAGNDSLDGGQGNDTLDGGSGTNTLAGGEGDDLFRINGDDNGNYAGLDSIDGGDDTDRIVLNASGKRTLNLPNGAGYGVRLDGSRIRNVELIESVGTSDDWFNMSGAANAATYRLGAGDDIFRGSLSDTVDGGDGDDWIDARYGFDPSVRTLLLGGNGNDTLIGSLGDDILDGGAENDLLLGDSGDDVLRGGEGDDRLGGEKGNDTLFGDGGADSVSGGAGDDALFGGSGNDSLDGGAGNDLVSGDEGNDLASGGLGDDLVTGGAGNDTVSGDGYDANAAYAKVNWSNWSSLSDADKAAALALVEGSDTDGNDTVLGDGNSDAVSGPGNDVVFGFGGNDLLTGGRGNDALFGGKGDDLLYGDEGNDSLFGGSGNDTLVGGLGSDLVDGGAGDDVIVLSRDGSWSGVNTYSRTSKSSDSSTTTDYGILQAVGLSDDNAAGGASGTDYARSRDTIDGGAGFDTVLGSADNDVVAFLVEENGTPIRYLQGIEFFNMGKGDDIVDLSGSIFSQETESFLGYGDYGTGIEGGIVTIDLGDGNDIAFGGAEKDYIIGGNGGDRLAGGAGADTLVGGDANGNDSTDTFWSMDLKASRNGPATSKAFTNIFVGGADDDLMIAGSGKDLFVFSKGAGDDVIQNFDVFNDVIALTTDASTGISFSKAMASGNDTLLTFSNNNSVRLVGVSLSDWNAHQSSALAFL